MSKLNIEKITVVIPSLKKRSDVDDFIEMVNKTSCYPLEIRFIEQNNEDITKVYAKELDSCETDIIVFMHDDIEFLKEGWGKILVDIFINNPKYGIIGVAGTKQYGIDNEIAWWKSPKEQHRGIVFHGDNTHSVLTMMAPYNLKSDVTEVAVIDGVFIACNLNNIEYNFDSDLKGFHFYDIDFCLANKIERSCKIGVTDRIAIRHKSTGNPNEEWAKNGQEVINKYKEYLPIKIFK